MNDKRNNIAHRLADILHEEGNEIRLGDIFIMHSLLTKVDTWWIVNVDIPTDPDLIGKDIDTD